MIENKTKDNSARLVVIPTPIGNLDDITLRALTTLKAVDKLYCEDTRVTKKLLTHFDIHQELGILNDHSDERTIEKIVGEISSGQLIGLVSDAGMPGISDPGYELIRAVHQANLTVEVLPGPCAFITALVGCGCAASEFKFCGFLPRQKQKIIKQIDEVIASQTVSVFYESPKRLTKTLELLKEYDGKILVSLAREVSKIHEAYTVLEKPSTLLSYYQTNPPKGEIVLIITPEEIKNEISYEQALSLAREQIKQGEKPTTVVKSISKEYQLDRKKLYQLVTKE